MDLLTLVMAYGLVTRTALFTPLGGVPAYASAAPGNRPDVVSGWQPDIAAATQGLDNPAAWIAAGVGAENGGQAIADGGPIRAPAGAMDLMLVMPQTMPCSAPATGWVLGPYGPQDTSSSIRRNAVLRTRFPLPAETQRCLGALVP